MSEHRRRSAGGAWFLLTGFVLGLALGLVYALVFNPVEYVDMSPSTLRSQDKDSYRAMIAQAFQSDGNLARARQRLALLKDGSGSQNLASQAQRLLAVNAADANAQALAILAAALAPQSTPSATPDFGVTPSPSLTPNPTVLAVSPSATLAPGQAIQTPTLQPSTTPTVTPTVTATPLVTFTPRYTEQPTPTLGAPFALKDRQKVCDPSLPQALLQVEVDNSAGQGIPGVKIQVTWPAGTDTFFTGLMPDAGPGYADYSMSPQVTYSLRAGEGGEVVQGLSIPTCTSGSSSYPGGWKIRFGQ
jgi:hypothetical protein